MRNLRLLFVTMVLCLTLGLAWAEAVGQYSVTLVAGGSAEGDGKRATETKLAGPFGVDFDRAGNLYFIEYVGHRVRRIDRKGVLTTLSGTGMKGDSGDGGPALQAQWNSPHSLAVTPDGTVYVADTFNSRVRKIDPKTHKVEAFAGTGVKGYSGDGGPAVSAQFGNVYCLALSPKGDRLYLDDLDNRRIRVVDMKTGIVTTVAGNGQRGVPADGSDALSSPLLDPRAVAVDAKGNLYILERSGNSLRVVDAQGKIRTVVGTGKPGPAGDGDAKTATLRGPKHLCVEPDGNVLIADTDNHMIRRYIPLTGRIERVAGTGQKGTAGVGGVADKLELNEPHGVWPGSNGTIYISDSMNDRILKLMPFRN